MRPVRLPWPAAALGILLIVSASRAPRLLFPRALAIEVQGGSPAPTGPLPGEVHLARIRQLTDGGGNADGSEVRRVSTGQGRTTCSYFYPDGKSILYASNVGDPSARNFDLYLISLDGTGLERATTNATFDGFPMFSPDGSQLVFASNRHDRAEGETNIFIADWIERPGAAK